VYIKIDETCDDNVAGLCDARLNMHREITDFTVMYPRLSTRHTYLLDSMGIMLHCCMPTGQVTDEIFGQDSCAQACAALQVLTPCKVEIEREDTQQHIVEIVDPLWMFP
jgi:hypothetical protein